MKIVSSPSFVRAAKRVVNKNPRFAEELKKALELLGSDLFHPSAQNAQIKGDLWKVLGRAA